jgi:hypothetical protein
MKNEYWKCSLCGCEFSITKDTKHSVIFSHAKSSCNRKKEISLLLTKEYLEKEYLIKKRSALDIAEEFGFGKSTKFIDGLLKKYKIEKRSCKQASNIDSTKEKRSKTSIEKYGVDNVFRAPDILKKISESKNSKTDAEKAEIIKKQTSTFKSHSKEDFIESARKRAKTMFEKYGVTNVAQFPHTRKKMSMSRMGFSESQESEWSEKRENKKIPHDNYSEIFFNKEFRKSILSQQSWCCGLCCVKRGDKVDEKTIKFPLHHIDRDKENNSRENLIFLCAFCHGKVHGGKNNFEKYKLILIELNNKFVYLK